MPFYLPDSPSSAAVIHNLPIYRIEDQQGSVYSLDRQIFVDPIPDIRPNLERKWSPTEYKSFEQITLEDRERLAGTRFVRRYTAFAVTYYSEDPKRLIGDYVDRQITPRAAADPDFTAADLRSMASTEEIKHHYPEGFDLPQWAAKGKLLWLDLEQPDLPLKSEPLDQFPWRIFRFPRSSGINTLPQRAVLVGGDANSYLTKSVWILKSNTMPTMTYLRQFTFKSGIRIRNVFDIFMWKLTHN